MPPPQPAARVSPPAAVPAPADARRRDVIASVTLLSLGFVSTIYTVFSATELDGALRQLYVMYGGEGDYAPAANLPLAGAVLVTSHLVLFAAAVLLTASRVRAGKISFWVPLVAGLVAGIVFFTTVTIVIAIDPALVEAAMAYATR